MKEKILKYKNVIIIAIILILIILVVSIKLHKKSIEDKKVNVNSSFSMNKNELNNTQQNISNDMLENNNTVVDNQDLQNTEFENNNIESRPIINNNENTNRQQSSNDNKVNSTSSSNNYFNEIINQNTKTPETIQNKQEPQTIAENKATPEQTVQITNTSPENKTITNEIPKSVEEPKKVENYYTLYDFGATWCGYCQQMKPIVQNCIKNYKNISLKEIDVDNNSDLSKKFKIQYLPTFVVIDKNGKEVERTSGYMGESEFNNFLSNYGEWCFKRNYKYFNGYVYLYIKWNEKGIKNFIWINFYRF